jgi:transposase
MTQTITIAAGIDTSKHKLDIAVHASAARWQVENGLAGWQQLANHLVEAGVTRVGIEATGGL